MASLICTANVYFIFEEGPFEQTLHSVGAVGDRIGKAKDALHWNLVPFGLVGVASVGDVRSEVMNSNQQRPDQQNQGGGGQGGQQGGGGQQKPGQQPGQGGQQPGQQGGQQKPGQGGQQDQR